MCAMAVVAALAGCGDDPVRVQNYPPKLTSIGPISKSGMQVAVDYSLRDAEGDDEGISAALCEATSQGEASDTCFEVAQGTASDGTDVLPTTPKGTDVPHRYAWAVGCGISDGTCGAPSLMTEYVFELSTETGDSVISSGTFTLDGLGFSEVPDCSSPADRVRSRPSACE
jgi:hypothetical protein